MSDIDNIKGYKPPAEGSGKFLKLNNGDTVKVRITSLPVIFQNEFKTPEGDINLSTRFAFVVWNHDRRRLRYGRPMELHMDNKSHHY